MEHGLNALTDVPKNYDMTVDWTPERWAEVRKMLVETERQLENGKFSDAFEDLEEARLKYGF